MSYEKAMKWARKHPKGTRQPVIMSTHSGFWPSGSFLKEDYLPYCEECKVRGIEPMECEAYYNSRLNGGGGDPRLLPTPHAFVPNPARPSLVVCFDCDRPEWDSIHIHSLPGMESVARQRAEALAVSTGELLSKRLREPPESIDKRTGEMERNAPLFRDTEANPERSLF